MRPRLAVAAVGLSFALLLVAAAGASAGYQQVGTFGGTLIAPSPPGSFPEEAQLGGASGMAVNVTGAGGVPAGTVYVAAQDPEHPEGSIRVVRFDPDGTFRMQWTSVAERCGTPEALPACQPRPSGGRGAYDLDVDQTTGNVYAFNGGKNSGGAKQIQVFNATGTELIAEFGEKAAFGETTAASPSKLHDVSGLPGAIAVDGSGKVYVFDVNNSDSFRYRLMVFEPQTPGDYEHYVYAGDASGVPSGTIGAGKEANLPSRPVIDDAGNIYVAGETYIEKFDPDAPTASPLCTLKVKNGGVRGMNVNPATGEVFYYNYKDRKIHQLSDACDAEGHFTEVEALSQSPVRGYDEALAVNPTMKWDPTGPPGILYGATPEEVGEAGGGEPGQSALGYIFAPAVSHEPVVESESVSGVRLTAATLNAQINPKGSPTSYVFQYLTEAAYEANEPSERFAGASEVPLGGAPLGSGDKSLLASAVVSGLSPDTGYRYRVVATSSEGVGVGTAEAFHTFPGEAPGLPDGRAYELVSPVRKDGGEVFPVNPNVGSCADVCKPGGGNASFPMQSSPDGDAVVYEGSAFSFGAGAVKENEYLSKRTDGGWQTTALSPSLQGSGEGFGAKAFNAELTEGILYQGLPTLTPAAPEGYFNLYRQPTSNPSVLSPLLSVPPFNRPPGASLKLTYAGASADFSRIFFEANDALTEASAFAPAAVDGGEEKKNLYEWAGGQLSLLNVLPGNVEAPPGAAFGRPAVGEGQPVLTHAISDDGSRVFWTSEGGQVYVREDGEATKAVPGAGDFVAAAAEGSRVLLGSGTLFDLDEESTTDLTEGKGGFQGILGQAEDLSTIYFVDTAVLDAGANEEGATAQAGQNNVYAWKEGTTTFVATLLAGDNEQAIGDWAASPVQRTAEASPDGRWVAFQSKAPLSGYDNVGPCKVVSGTKQVEDGPCTEIFLYDSLAGALTCPSCKITGERPLGGSTLARMLEPKGSLPQPRYLLDSGRLYFDSRDSLSAFDTNEGVEDVYQYEPDGVGGCAREAGCVSLISAGSEGIDSNFLATDPSGKNVFFTTRDQLVLPDRDELIDLYVAREGGGISAETETLRPECQGEACQPASTPPNDPTPASSTRPGAGNVKRSAAARRCAKGKRRVRRKGKARCLPAHPKQHKRVKEGSR